MNDVQKLASIETSHYYQVYGLTLAANKEIPGLNAEKVADDHIADSSIGMGFMPLDIEHLIELPTARYYVEPGYKEGDPEHLIVNTLDNGRYFQFIYGDGVDFLLDKHNSAVWCTWKDPLTLEDVALYLLGPIIGFMLRLRGTVCLHASGVLVNEQAFAITGPSGAGKSTLAASFAAAGYPILTDDVLPLTTTNGEVHTQSGYSRLRLFPNSFENLPELPNQLPLLAPGWDKCFLDLASDNYQLHTASAPLKVIYVVDWGSRAQDSPSISPIAGTAAVPILAANTYRNELLSAEMRKKEFYFLSALASRITVKKLCPVDDISTIPLVREMLLADFKQDIMCGQIESVKRKQDSGKR